MFRSLILMTLLKTASITKWVKQTRSLPFFSVFSGFLPDDTPGVGTYYDFLKRIINGPYQKPCSHWVRPTRHLTGLHPRNLGSEKSARKDKADPCHSQSQLLVNELLAHSEQPRTTGLAKLLEDLLIRVAIIPAIQEGLVTDLHNLIVSGDASILCSAASPRGKPSCSCRAEGIHHCRHERLYTSPTAQWCYDAYRDGKSVYIFRHDECPAKQDCAPQSSLGPLVYLKANPAP